MTLAIAESGNISSHKSSLLAIVNTLVGVRESNQLVGLYNTQEKGISFYTHYFSLGFKLDCRVWTTAISFLTEKAIAWRWKEYCPLPPRLDIAYKLKENHWQGNTSIELEIVGVRSPKNKPTHHPPVKKAVFTYKQ